MYWFSNVCYANIFVGMLLIFQMVPLINTATETLLNNLKTNAESGDSFDIHRYRFPPAYVCERKHLVLPMLC